MKEKNNRFKQADKEAVITIIIYLGYFVWWYALAYGLGQGDPKDYDYVFGFPAWFFYSCIVGYPILTIILWIVMKIFFKDIELDEPSEKNEN